MADPFDKLMLNNEDVDEILGTISESSGSGKVTEPVAHTDGHLDGHIDGHGDHVDG